MKNARTAIAAAIALALSAVAVSAQSVSGLSVKTRSVEEPVTERSASEPKPALPKTVRDLLRQYREATTEKERTALVTVISGLRVVPEVLPETERGQLRAAARNLLATETDPVKKASLRASLRALADPEPSVSLAVPAGATAALSRDETAAAGPVMGFQAWRPDDFFAGAFFTFDTPARLNGDGRRANEFLRNPPATGTSFYASASKIVGAINRDSVVGYVTRRTADDGQQVAYFGFALRMGATNATLERQAGDEVIAKEAFIFHFTPALLLTSRTFRDVSGGEYQFGVELGLAGRVIGGDAAHDKAFLSAPDVLGSDDRRRFGFDGTLFVRLNAFQPFVRMTYFDKSNDAHQAAFSGFQATFGINVQSSLFQTAGEK